MSIFYQERSEPVWLHISNDPNFAPHLHRQVELVFVLEGQLLATVNGKDFCLHQEEGILIFPNRLHAFSTPAKSRILICIFEETFCPDYRAWFQKSEPENPSFSLSELSAHSRTALGEILSLTADFDLNRKIPFQPRSYAKAYLSLLLTDFSVLFSKEASSGSASRVSPDLALEQQLLLYIESHYTENISLKLLAHTFGISTFQISRIFSSRLHTSLPRYINAKRLEHAKDLLAHSGQSVTQIALDAGFGSTRTFFREFHHAFGISPGEYRHSGNLL